MQAASSYKAWIFPILWMLFYGYWSLSALRVNKAKEEAARLPHIIHVSIVILGLLLTLTNIFRIGLLKVRFLPLSSILFLTGFLLASLGLSLAVWARTHLGQYWSGSITLKEDHQIINTGPYAVLRHPIYTGILVGMIGTGIALGKIRGLLAVCLYLLSYGWKIQREEFWLLNKFGSKYNEYRKETWALIPLIF